MKPDTRRSRSFPAVGSGMTTHLALQVCQGPVPMLGWNLLTCRTNTGPPLATIDETYLRQFGHISEMSATLLLRSAPGPSVIRNYRSEEALPLKENGNSYTPVDRSPKTCLQTLVG